jgi:dihydroorotase
MKVLIKQARIISSSSPFNGKIKDILVTNGIITAISDAITEKTDQVIAYKDLAVSTGWMDIFANFADPGQEYKETLETGAKAAAAGGFTDVMVLPNTNPVVHNKSGVEYIVQRSKPLAVSVHPIGAVTKNAEGKDLAEMYDMHQSGAIAFGDGTNPIQSAGIVLKALQYVKSFDGTVIQIPEDKSIGVTGLINEGIISTQLGLPGKPTIAEEILIARDIKLAGYAESKLHFTGVSSAKSIACIRSAKENGINITCSVTPYHLFFTDTNMQDYDTNLKVNPPLRTETDRQALLEAVIDGTVDCIASHHFPQNWDSKTCEFEYAKEGMIGLESLFGVMGDLGLSTERIVELLTNPRKIFGLQLPEIKEGAAACLSLFIAGEEYIFDEKMIKSKSKNSPFIGKKLKGKVIGIINKDSIELN